MFTIHKSQDKGQREEGRYEHRCWPVSPMNTFGRLEKYGNLTACEQRTDIYLLSCLSHHTLVKLRAGRRLEIKSMEHEREALQYWRKTLSCEFPLKKDHLKALREALDCSVDLPISACELPSHLLASIAEAAPQVTVASIQKSRALFEIKKCRVDASVVYIRNQRHLTFGLEAESYWITLNAARFLNLSLYPNLHYGEVLLSRPARLQIAYQS